MVEITELVDAHLHLQDERFKTDVAELVKRAEQAGVTSLFCCGTEEKDWPAVADLASRYACVRPFFGVHPWFTAGRTPNWREQLLSFLQAWPLAGVGEIGLDSVVGAGPDQEGLFREQLIVARDYGRPAAIHCRRAWEKLLAILAAVGELPGGFLVHSYSGSVDLIPSLAARGSYFSFSGSITWPNNKRGQLAIKAVPADRLLLETDAPDLLPYGLPSGQLNEPANLQFVLATAAALREVSPLELARQTTANAKRFGRWE